MERTYSISCSDCRKESGIEYHERDFETAKQQAVNAGWEKFVGCGWVFRCPECQQKNQGTDTLSKRSL